MKKIKYLILMLVLFLVPFVAFAEEDATTSDGTTEDNRAIVYFFHGDGCPHCAEAEEWFDSIQEEYGSKFVIEDYEVWKNEDNANLMNKIAEGRDELTENFGVPYIIIGDKSWDGFDETQMGSEIKAQIDQVYNTPVEDRYDALKLYGNMTDEDEKGSNDTVALIIILVVVAGIGFAIYEARKTTK